MITARKHLESCAPITLSDDARPLYQFSLRGRPEVGARERVCIARQLYIGDLRTQHLENRLPFELLCSATTYFKGFVELSSLPLYLGRFGGRKEV